MAGVVHPSKNMLLGALVMLFMALVFSAVAVSTPAWSRISGSLGTEGITARAADLLFVDTSVVTTKSVLYIGLWEWCLAYGDDMDTTSCSEVRQLGIPAHGNDKCVGHLIAAQTTAVMALGFSFVALLLTALVFTKVSAWRQNQFWSPPTGPLALAFLVAILGFGLACAAFATWIVVAEETCSTAFTAWNPMSGYSTAFIFQCFTSGWLLIASLLLLVALLKLKKIPVMMEVKQQEQVVYVEEPTYPVTMDSPYMAPVSQPAEVAYSVTQPMYPASAPVY